MFGTDDDDDGRKRYLGRRMKLLLHCMQVRSTSLLLLLRTVGGNEGGGCADARLTRNLHDVYMGLFFIVDGFLSFLRLGYRRQAWYSTSGVNVRCHIGTVYHTGTD